MRLNSIAEYIADGDLVLTEVSLYDEVEEVYHPELLRAGEADLLFLGNPITKTIVFDRRMGNADGSFKFTFSHPPKIKNLQFRVHVTLMDNTEYTETIGLTVDCEVSFPFIENPLAGTDHRTRKREEEGL